MSKIGLAILLLLMAGRNFAQPDYFILIQADNQQPFYFRLEGRLLSSSPQGHLIVSQLREGVYTITVGFPGRSLPEETFLLSVGKNDQEFELKDNGEKGWGLFNLQTREWVTQSKRQEAGPGVQREGVKKDDAFSRLMAGVVSDTAVMYNTYAMEATLKDSAGSPASLAASDFEKGKRDPQINTGAGKGDTDVRKIILSIDSSLALSKQRDTAGSEAAGHGLDSLSRSPVTTLPELGQSVSAAGSALAPAAPQVGFVVKVSERKTNKGVRLVYADHRQGLQADTIVVVIPTTDTLTGPALASRMDSGQKANAAVAHPLFINSDCRNFATEYDVDRLRVKLLESGKDEERLGTARKVFKSKCFSTKQIRALTEVFPTDPLKFRFLETAYPFVSDSHFKELAELLVDPVYNSKFRTMTGQ